MCCRLLLIEQLKSERDQMSKQSADIKMKCMREKEELVRHLEKIEQDIIKREKDVFTQNYEKLLVESCEAVRAEEARKFRNEVDSLKIRYEREIDGLKEMQHLNEKRLQEQQELLVAKYTTDLSHQFEAMSQSRLNEFLHEKKSMESRIVNLEQEIAMLNASLNEEKEKSAEKSAEMLTLNKQKFKLMAQLKQSKKEADELSRDAGLGNMSQVNSKVYNALALALLMILLIQCILKS